MLTVIHGGLIGLTIAMPIGPVCLLCIGRTLSRGCATGLLTGLGAVTVHAAYGAAAVFTNAAAMLFLRLHMQTLQMAGGLALSVCGLVMLVRSRGTRPVRPTAASFTWTGRRGDYLSGIALAMTNPLTLSGFLAGVAAFSVEGAPPAETVGGIALGSASWYSLVCVSALMLRRHLSATLICWLNGLSALVTCGAGIGMAAAAM
jgi:threonine/homoserine/homoserine lactone efflux protein